MLDDVGDVALKVSHFRAKCAYVTNIFQKKGSKFIYLPYTEGWQSG